MAGFVTSSSPVPLKTGRVGQRCMSNLSRAQTSSRCCGVVVRRGGASSETLVHGSVGLVADMSWIRASNAEDPPGRGGRCMLNMSGFNNLPFGVVRKLGEKVQLSRCHLTMVQNDEVHRQ
ncbi:hypothetical protein TNCV_2411651 [Trichonephila clavipes]|nr:hypothetical protein TNCV_2411651 [Trichonephila clavipes]